MNILALSVHYLGSEDYNVRIVEEPDFTWQLTAFNRPAVSAHLFPDQQNYTSTYVWLDTTQSNAERLGRNLRMCHQYVPLQLSRSLTWSYDTLRKSVGDTGDCRALVSDACLKRLEAHYTSQAVVQRSGQFKNHSTAARGCAVSRDATVPWECADSGMVPTLSQGKSSANLNRFISWARATR